jgi:hypothetical protein
VSAFVEAVRANLAVTDRLFAGELGGPPRVLATVSGSAAAQRFWQHQLDRAAPALGARVGVSLHEDLPVNQAFGLLLLGERLRPRVRDGEGALAAFVFGEGTRATPFTETEGGQKPALWSFVRRDGRFLSTVEVALRTFAPVEAYLRRSGFEGLVVKWGDEIQVPTLDLSGVDPALAEADVVRFVSLRAMTDDDARQKDWVGVDASGEVTAFIPRRPLAEMAPLAARGLLRRDGDRLVGGINLGSIALSWRLLDVLLEELGEDVHDATAHRKDRPDLDPQLFTALCVARIDEAEARRHAWEAARAESAAMEAMHRRAPGLFDRLRRALEAFAARHGRPARIRALDFGDQYWGDIGQHRQMRALYGALRSDGPDGEVARALAGVGEADAEGNRIDASTVLGPEVDVRGSVLLGARVDAGTVIDSVLLGTHVEELSAEGAFDVGSRVGRLRLAPESGAYRLLERDAEVGPGERATTVILEDEALLLRVEEDTDLRDRTRTYDVPILGNPRSFRDVHGAAVASDPEAIAAARRGRLARLFGSDDG